MVRFVTYRVSDHHELWAYFKILGVDFDAMADQAGRASTAKPIFFPTRVIIIKYI